LKDLIEDITEDLCNKERELLNKWNSKIKPWIDELERHKSQSLSDLNVEAWKELKKLTQEFSREWRGIIMTRAQVNYLFDLQEETRAETYLLTYLELIAKETIKEKGDIINSF